MSYDSELNVALLAVRSAARMCSSVQSQLVTSDTLQKKDRSPVTIADYASQAVISSHLQTNFPKDVLVGEEDVTELQGDKSMRTKILTLVQEQLPEMNETRMLEAIARGSRDHDPKGRFWTVDPIDGTKGFLRQEQYAVALALLEDGEVTLGVLGCPNLPLDFNDESKGVGCLLWAVREKGAFMSKLDGSQSRHIHVNPVMNPREARFVESVEAAHSAHDIHDHISQALEITPESLRIDSQCKYAAVSRGDVSIYLRYPKDDVYREKIWDHAAGSVIVEEGGGKVTDIYGKKLDFGPGRKLMNNQGIVATNGNVHQAIIDVIAKMR